MDFLFGPQNNDKTTCLLHLANQFILNNNIKPNNGYILLFTPPHSENPKSNEKSQIKNERKVQFEEGKKKLNLKDNIFMECSVKNGINVKEIFIEAAKLLYKKSNINSTDKKPLENAQKVNEINNEVIDNSKNEKVIKKEEKNCCSRCFD